MRNLPRNLQSQRDCPFELALRAHLLQELPQEALQVLERNMPQLQSQASFLRQEGYWKTDKESSHPWLTRVNEIAAEDVAEDAA